MMQPDIPNSFLKLLCEGKIISYCCDESIQCTEADYIFYLFLILCIWPGFESVEEDRKLRLFAVESYVSLLQVEPGKLPQRFLQVISWVSFFFFK